MQLHFNSFECVYVPHTCNKVAHVLVAYGASRQDIKLVWSDSLPDDVRVLVASASTVPSN
jgi:hypothetical protein